MKNPFKKIKDIVSHKELWDRIKLTLGLILIYRIGSFVILPGVDSNAVAAKFAQIGGEGFGLTDLIGMFTGGAFSKASIFALGIMPYISASIIMQLMGIAVPSVQKLQNDGESGRKKITQYTRFLTIAITLVQAPGYLASSVVGSVSPDINHTVWFTSSVIILTACTLFIMWLGEKITEKGIGNGISLIIMIGIIAMFPQALLSEFIESKVFLFIVEMMVFFVVIMASIALVQAVRRVPIQMAKMNTGGSFLPTGDGQRSYVPLKLNSSGVMPIIFAQAIMVVPMLIGNMETFRESTIMRQLGDFYSWPYNLLAFLLVVAFTYLYTAITVDTNSIADNLKRQGTFVPGIKPGRPTAEYLDEILSKITLWGAIFLGLITILPAIVYNLGFVSSTQFSIFFGGTSLLILVGVVLDTLQQIDSYLLSRHYDGLMKSGKLRGRHASPVSGITSM